MVRPLLLVHLGVLLVGLVVRIVLGVDVQLVVVVQPLAVVVEPLVLVVVLRFVFLLHRRFVLVLLVLQVFLMGSVNRNGSDIVLPLT
jgi:hypothetical protein